VVLAAIMNFLVDWAVAWSVYARESAPTVPLMPWANIIYSILVACFSLCVLTFVACIVDLVRQKLHSTS
jgi:hypothetical protein